MPILLILQIIAAIPGLVKAFKEIIDLIRELRGKDKEMAQAELSEIVHRHKMCHDKEGCEAEVNGLLERLKNRHGVAPQGA